MKMSMLVVLVLLAAQPAFAQDTRPAMPSEVAGFRLGGTLAQARAACRAAGHEWEDPQRAGDAGICAGTAASIGHDAIVMVTPCGDRICSVGIRVLSVGDAGVLRAVGDFREALTARYGEAEYVYTGAPYCEEAAGRGDITCVAAGQGQFIWRWYTRGGGILGVMVTRDQGRAVVWLHYSTPEQIAVQDERSRSLSL